MAAAALRADSGPRAGWRGELGLALAPRHGRTALVRRRHRGPLVVQSPLYPEGDVCHLILLHPPGGLVGGDVLDVDVHAAPGSRTLVTTPASGKLYRSAGAACEVRQHVRIEEGAGVEWLPAESIVFDGAVCDAQTRIDLERGSRLLAWEGWVLGRHACNEGFAHGRLRVRLEVRRGGRPLLVERQALDGGGAWLHACAGLAGYRACATLVAHPACADTLDLARGAVLRDGAALAAASVVDGLLVCRVLAHGLVPLRRQLEAWWRSLRPAVAGLEPTPPRIWAT